VSTPTRINHIGPTGFLPFAVSLEFQSNFAFFTWLQRKELRRHLQRAAVVGIQSERDDLIARHVHFHDAFLPAALLFPILRRRLDPIPPFAGGMIVQTGKLGAKRLRVITVGGDQTGDRDGADSKQGIDSLHERGRG